MGYFIQCFKFLFLKNPLFLGLGRGLRGQMLATEAEGLDLGPQHSHKKHKQMQQHMSVTPVFGGHTRQIWGYC